MARVTRPETHTLTLRSGETLIIRRRLNNGERRKMLASMRDPVTGRADALTSGIAMVLAYLLDWTVKDELSGEALVIRGKSRDEIATTIDSLDPEDAREIEKAIDAWDDVMLAERANEKKVKDGTLTSETTLPSAPASDSATQK